MRIAIAALLGICSFLLMFAVGSVLQGTVALRASELEAGVLLVAIMGGYFTLAMYLLWRGAPQGGARESSRWAIVALTTPLLLAAAIALIVEPDKLAAMETLAIAAIGVAGAYLGLALAREDAARR